MQETNKNPVESGAEQVQGQSVRNPSSQYGAPVRSGGEGFLHTCRNAPRSNGTALTAWPPKPARRPSRSGKSRAIGWRSRASSPRRRANCSEAMPICGVARSAGVLGEEVEPVVEPEPGDNRFKDPDWSNGQFFDFWKQAYLITSRWAEDLTRNTEGVDEKTRQEGAVLPEPNAGGVVAFELRADQPGSGPHHARDQRRESGAGHGPFRSGPRAVEGSAAHQPDGSLRLRDRTEPRRDAGQGRVPERPDPAHPICAGDRGGL